ncbi:MAG: hypothetical protein ACKVS9_05695 [Phycisphaerae bacterium]
MNYLGTARIENGRVVMPDGFAAARHSDTFEAIEIGGDILLITSPLDRKRLDLIDALVGESINDHRKSLEGLAK